MFLNFRMFIIFFSIDSVAKLSNFSSKIEGKVRSRAFSKND